jgi:hypothetical protein
MSYAEERRERVKKYAQGLIDQGITKLPTNFKRSLYPWERNEVKQWLAQKFISTTPSKTAEKNDYELSKDDIDNLDKS